MSIRFRSEIPDRVVERLVRHVERDESSGCVISLYSVMNNGYAQIGWGENGKTVMMLAHRVAWIASWGEIPDGMTVDHLCKTRRCINVEHLRLLSNFENARRTNGRDWPLGECANGHPNSELRTKSNGFLECGPCRLEMNRRNRQRARERGVPASQPHGRRNTYTYYGCRCASCRAAYTDYMRKFRESK